MTPRAVALALCAAVALTCAPAADGKIRRFGSSLKAKAKVHESRGSDTVYWHRRSSRGAKSPGTGQVLSVKIKGKALSDRVPGDSRRGGETLFHLQTLVPQSGGRTLVGATSGPLYMPNQNARTQGITTFRPGNLCIKKGETVGFNTVGGYWPEGYPSGTPMLIFAKRPRSKFRRFTGGGQTGNGAVFGSETVSRRELLMQVKIGTGRHSNGICRGARSSTAGYFRRSGRPVPAT